MYEYVYVYVTISPLVRYPPLGGKYCYYQFRRRHYQFKTEAAKSSYEGRGFFLGGGEITHIYIYIYVYDNSNSNNTSNHTTNNIAITNNTIPLLIIIISIVITYYYYYYY